MNLSIWQFFAGVALFIYAMGLIENSLKHLAGRSLKKFLEKHSRSRFKVVVSSTIITAILQSSSIVILMVLSFVGAGLLKMPDALAASLGANLGSTLNSWIIALIGFKINFFVISFPILAFSLIGLLIFKKKTWWSYFTTFFIGCAFLFIGLEWMKESVDKSMYKSLGEISHYHYLVFFPIGCLITAIVQSGSVTIAIVLTALNSNLIPFEHAVCMMLGSEMGSTLKYLLGSIGGIVDKKRAAWGNFFVNLIVTGLAAAFIFPIIYFIQEIAGIKNQLTGLVVFQSGINTVSVLLFLPLLGVLARMMERMIKSDEGKGLTKFIRTKQTALPGDAIELAEKEIENLLMEAVTMNKRILGIKNHDENKDGIFTTDKGGTFNEKYEKIKILQGEILEYLSSLRKEEMNEQEISRSEELITIVRHILRAGKNLKDIRHNLEEFESSANDALYDEHEELKRMAAEFYTDFLQHFNGEEISEAAIKKLMDENRKEYDDSVAQLLMLKSKSEISNLESTNLLNVYREIYSSNKALILSLAELKGIQV